MIPASKMGGFAPEMGNVEQKVPRENRHQTLSSSGNAEKDLLQVNTVAEGSWHPTSWEVLWGTVGQERNITAALSRSFTAKTSLSVPGSASQEYQCPSGASVQSHHPCLHHSAFNTTSMNQQCCPISVVLSGREADLLLPQTFWRGEGKQVLQISSLA